MDRVSAATTIAQLLVKPCTDSLPFLLDDGGKCDSWLVFLGCIPVAAPEGSIGVSSPGPAWAARAGEEDDGGCSHSHQVSSHIQKSGKSLLTGTFTQAGFSTPTGDSAAFPTVWKIYWFLV